MNSPMGVRWAFFRVFLVGVLLLGMSHSVHAQGVTTASITGKVSDASGAAVPETMISVTNEETGATRNTASDAQGDFEALQLQIGRYDIKAEKMGFKTAQQTGIDLVVGQQAVVNLTLSIGDVQQVVTVSEEAPLVNTTTAPTSGVVGEKSVKELPLNGRSFDTLIALNAGATNISTASGAAPGSGGVAAQQGQEFSVSGRRWSENLFLLNGVEYPGPSQVASEPGGVSGQLLGVDAVREFNVVSDAYGASYGHRAGAQISIATQSGSNNIHGSVFEFIRNSDLDSRNIFNLPTATNPAAGKVPAFKRNQFGGAVGGPIQKDKTFLFGNYEGFRQLLNITDVIDVPDNQARLGNLPSTANASCGVEGPATNLDANMLPFIQGYWPVANQQEITQTAPNTCTNGTAGTQIATGIAQGTYLPLNSIREDFGTARFDHTFSDKDTLGAIYTIDDGLDQDPEVDPLFVQDISIRAQILSFQETHIFSPTVINSFITGYSRSGFGFFTPAVGCPAQPQPTGCANFPNPLLFSAGRNPGELLITTGNIANGGGSNATGQISHRNLFTMTDNVQVVKGRHTIGFGGWAGYLASNELAPNSQSGQATFSNIQALLSGTSTNLFTPVQNTLYWRQWEGAWFVEDNIQVRSNLTVRLGLRQEFTNGYNEDKGNGYNYLYDPSNPGVLLTNPVQAGSPLTQNNAVALFAPRMAVAWDPTGKGKMSIRAGGGIYYDTLDTLGQQFLDRAAPLNPNESLQSSTGSFTNVFPAAAIELPQCGPGVPTGAANCANYSPFGVQSFLRVPTIYEWNLTYQQAITPNTSVSIAYVGSHGVHQITSADPNQLFSTFCTNPAGCTAGGNTGKTSTAALGQLYVPVVNAASLTADCPAGCLRNPFLAQGQMQFDFGNTRYNALNVEVTHRFSYGLQFKGAYTYSRDEDNAGVSGGGVNITDPYYARLDWGPSIENQTHKFVFSGGYELPFGKGKHFGNGVTGVADKLVSGWQLNWVATVESGLPFTPTGGNNVSGNAESGRTGNQAPDYSNSFSLANLYTGGPGNAGTLGNWFNASNFVQPTTPGLFPYVSRDLLTKPGLAYLNFSVIKNTKINERISVQFRAEAFNMLNNVNWGTPSTTTFTSSGAPSSTAGAITTINGTAREIQFGLKGIF